MAVGSCSAIMIGASARCSQRAQRAGGMISGALISLFNNWFDRDLHPRAELFRRAFAPVRSAFTFSWSRISSIFVGYWVRPASGVRSTRRVRDDRVRHVAIVMASRFPVRAPTAGVWSSWSP